MRQMLRAEAGLLFAGMATFVLMGAGQSLYGPALPAFTRAFGVGLSEAGLLISAHWVGAAVGVTLMFLRGHWATPRRVLLVMALGAAMVATGAAWGLTLAGAVVFGTGYGAATTIYNRRFLNAFGARGPAMVGQLNAVFGLGAIAAPLIFVALGSQPQLSYGLVAGLALLAFLGAGSVRPEAPPPLAHGPGFRLRLDILAFGVAAIGVEASLIGLGPTALIAAGETEAHAAQLLSAFFVAFLAARVGLLWLADAVPAFALLVLALFGAGLCALGAASLSAAWFFVPLGGFAGLFFPPFYVTAAARMGSDPRVSPSIIAAGLIGGIAAPLLMGGLMSWLGDGQFFWIIAAFTLSTAAAGLLSLRRA
ncbi:MFS transporter [Rhodobacter ferrooxidans]|uniref:Major facilitator transporter n=1 Tax=Rhodobacter ferrooxidans TaxID=371731 RepID=C8RWR6_9RHOB|nr:MFS transporter [Rhodobacter sp. SW2]EEW27009.1 major facilitator transporter [Rhodobacter sp. SW2]